MTEPHLRIYKNRSELFDEEGNSISFLEGKPDSEAKRRRNAIKEKLHSGWFSEFVKECIQNPSTDFNIEEKHRKLIKKLVESVTSEVGRALIGLTVLQLTIKAIETNQSVRLHKGGNAPFSWKAGITMRTLDSKYIEPVLREHDLLYINKYGVFMTRSLAENYPYTQFYKAAIRGGKEWWLAITDEIEKNELDGIVGLRYILSLLSNKSQKFKEKATEAIQLCNRYVTVVMDSNMIFSFILKHIKESSYSARLFEIAAHSLIQTIQERGDLDGFLLPLCQMRTANKKHRSIGDVEIVVSASNNRVVEAWDAKYGKPYLRDELEELNDKLISYGSVDIAGFITDGPPEITEDIRERLSELQDIHDTKIEIFDFQTWVEFWCERIDNCDDVNLAKKWLLIYVESLCQLRRDSAPIDEPSDQWIIDLIIQFKTVV